MTSQILKRCLLPAAAVAGVLASGLACGGASRDAIRPVPTQAPLQGGADREPSPLIELAVDNGRFTRSRLVAPAEKRVSIELENRDSGVPHNVSVYRSAEANDSVKPVFVGHIVTGVTTANYVFKSPDAGVYYFRCDLNPATMSGTFLVE